MEKRRPSVAVMLLFTSALMVGCTPPPGDATDTTSATSSTSATASPTATRVAVPAGFHTVGGPENGIRLAVPAKWVEIPSGPEVRSLHGFSVVDAKGAANSNDYEAHLVASCRPNPGFPDAQALQDDAPRQFGAYQNLSVDTVDFAGRTVVTVSFDDRTPAGRVEHWYEYVFLADGDRLCLITLTTPLNGAARDAIKAIFDQIGPTMETLPPPG